MMMKKCTFIIVAALVVIGTMCAPMAAAWEPPEDFGYETPYSVQANCGGGCHVQLGKNWLHGDANNNG